MEEWSFNFFHDFSEIPIAWKRKGDGSGEKSDLHNKQLDQTEWVASCFNGAGLSCSSNIHQVRSSMSPSTHYQSRLAS